MGVRALAALLLLLLLPASAQAGWPRAREVVEAVPHGLRFGPHVRYVVEDRDRLTVVRHDRRGTRRWEIPGSEDRGRTAFAADRDGNVVVAWSRCGPGPDEFHQGWGSCGPVLATSFRRGQAPPPARIVSGDSPHHLGAVHVAMARGVAVVAWSEDDDIFDESTGTHGFRMAGGRAGEPMHAHRLAEPGAKLLSLPAARDPRAAIRLIVPRGRRWSLVRREIGPGGAPRRAVREATLPKADDVYLLQSERGDRALFVPRPKGVTEVRLARPGRGYGPLARLPLHPAGFDAAIGPRGHVATADYDRGALVHRGAPGRRWRSDRVRAPHAARSAEPDVEVDAAGRTYMTFPEARGRSLWTGVYATHADLGGRFARPVLIARSRNDWSCGPAGLFVLGPGVAEAYARCEPPSVLDEVITRSAFRSSPARSMPAISTIAS